MAIGSMRIALVVALTAMMVATSAFAVARQRGDVQWITFDPARRSDPVSKAVGEVSDIEGIAVLEISGGYDRFETQPRVDVARRYLSRYRDEHDLLLVFSAFEFDTGEAAAIAHVIKNDTQGIGVDLFDHAAAFGSASGRLHNYIDMGALSRWEWNPASPRYGVLLDVAAHEVMHRWVAHPQYLRSGQPSSDLLGRDGTHWSFFLDSDASLMYGADWRLGSDGHFEAVDIGHRFSPLDLYLAGWFSAAEVPPMSLIRDGLGAAAQDIPVLGFRTTGTIETIDIEQIVAANGPRRPDVTQSARHLSAGILLLHRPGQPLAERDILGLQRFARDFETRFAALTRGRASLSVHNPIASAGNGAPPVVSGSGPCAGCALEVERAKTWLRSRQRSSDGAFVDKTFNAVPSTAAALRAIYSSTDVSSQPQLARAWLGSASARQFDDLAWKARTGTSNPVGDADLEAGYRQSLDGTGPGVLPAEAANAWDMAAAIDGAWFSALDGAGQQAYLQRLRTLQNPDGGFGISPGGRSHVGLTAWVLEAVAPLIGAAPIADAAATWLQAQRNGDGSFGGGEDGVLSTAWAIAGLVRLGRGIDTGKALSYLAARQGVQGDWNGSVFTTAEVVRVLGQIDKPNLSFDGAISASPAAPISGDVVQLRAGVRNHGASAHAVELRWFLGAPDAGGTPIGEVVSLGDLGAGQGIQVSMPWNSSGHSGAQSIHAVIDPANVIDELDESDNRRVLLLDVAALPAAPDAALLRERVTLTPSSVGAYPVPVTVSGALLNLGGAALTDVPVVLYTLRNGVRREVARQLLNVAAQGEAELNLGFTLQRDDPLSLILVADPENSVAEIRENNNQQQFELATTQGVDIAISASDLVQLTRPAMAERPARFRITVRNHGAAASPTFELAISVRQGEQAHVLSTSPLQLDAGASAEREVEWASPVAGPATLEAVAILSPASGDGNPDNNRALLPFDVVSPDVPNLSVSAASIRLSPMPLKQGQPATLHATFGNSGAALSAAVTLAVSTAGEGGSRNEVMRTTLDGGVAAGGERSVDLALPVLADAGERYFFLDVDPENQIVEIDENDNAAFVRQHVLSLPDAAVSVASVRLVPAVPVAGALVSAQVAVRNIGEQPITGMSVRLHSGTSASAGLIPPVQSVDIAAGGVTQVSWEWQYAAPDGTPSLSVELDPDQRIPELREDNNLAFIALQPLGNEYATEPYISPDGDGVKDTTQVVFRALPAQPALIEIRDVANRVVRTYAPEEFTGSEGWAISWDGLDDTGILAADGRYRARALAADGVLLGEVVVVVDTNRLSVLEAIGTPLGRYTDLQRSDGSFRILVPPRGARDPDTVLLVNPLNPATADPGDRLTGIYRYDVLLGTLEPMLDALWLDAQGTNPWIVEMHWAEAGDDLVLVLRASERDSVWTIRVHGRNVARQLSAPSPARDTGYELHSSGRNHVLLWSSHPQSALARRYRLDTGAIEALSSGDARGAVLNVLEQGFLVAEGETALYFVSFDPAVPARTVLDAAQRGYVAHVGAHGAVVHRVEDASEIVEWRSLHSAAVQTMATHARTEHQVRFNRCALEPERPTWFGGGLLVRDHGRRVAGLIDVDNGTVRNIPLPLVDQVGGYRSLHLGYFFEYSQQLELRGVDRSSACPLSLWNAAAAAAAIGRADAQSATGKQLIGRGSRVGREPVHALVLDGEQLHVVGRDNDTDYFSSGATSAYLLDRRTGEVSLLGRYTNWPLLDARDQDAFPALFVRDGIENAVMIDARPDALLDEFNRRTATTNPLLALSDGSGVAQPEQTLSAPEHRIFLAGGYQTGAIFPFADQPWSVWPSEQHLSGTYPSPRIDITWFYSSLANQATRLRARGGSRGIEFHGIAADRNFLQYELAWAHPEMPQQWHAIGVPVMEPVLDGELMSWTPPAAGWYLLRLRSEDRAGNRREVVARALSPASSDIAGAHLATRYVSPNGDGVQDALHLSFEVLRPTTLEFRIVDADGGLIRRHEQQYLTGAMTWSWDGRDQLGAIAADGRYRLSVNQWFSASFTLDTTPPALEIRRTPAPHRWAQGRTARIEHSRVYSEITWHAIDSNPRSIALQRSEGAAPGSWSTFDDALALEGKKTLPKDDAYNYRVVAEDLAGNRSVSAAVGAQVVDLGLVGRHGWSAGASSPVWGCVVRDDCVYQYRAEYGRYHFVGEALRYPIEPGAKLALDLHLSPDTPHDDLRLRYRVDAYGAAAAVGTWQELVIEDTHHAGTELRIQTTAPALPLGSRITVEAATRLTDGSLLFAEPAAFEYAGLSAPKFYSSGARCTPPGVDAGLPPPLLPASWACAEEAVSGLLTDPTMTVIAADGSAVAVQSAARIVDGVLLFELPRPDCREIIVRARSTSGRAYESRSPCPGGNIAYNVNVAPDVSLDCGAQPNQRKRYHAWFLPTDGTRVTRLRADVVLHDGSLREIVNRVDPPRMTAGCAPAQCASSGEIGGMFDAADLPDGRYTMRFSAELSNGFVSVQDAVLGVDRSPATIDIRFPRDGGRACVDPSAKTIRVDVVAGDSLGVDSELSLHRDPVGGDPEPPLTVGNWTKNCALRSDSNDPPLLMEPRDILPDRSCVDIGAPRDPPQPFSGPSVMQYQVLNWSGAPQCRVVHFQADDQVEFDLEVGHVEARRRPRAELAGSGDRIAVINPVGDPRFHNIDLRLRAREPIQARLELWPYPEREGDRALAVLSTDMAYAEGTHTLAWNGRLMSGAIVDDGLYLLSVVTGDDCGRERRRSVPIIVDTQPPVLSFVEPAPAAEIGALIVPISFHAADLSGGAVSLVAETAQSIPLISGNLDWAAGDEPGFRTQWNRGGEHGNAMLRLTASDVVGNQRSAELPLRLQTRPAALLDDATLNPQLFSPNGDGAFDRIELRYALSTSADITARVVDADGSQVALLRNAEPSPAGNHVLVWDGIGLPASHADGQYRIELRAARGAEMDAVDLPFAVDVSRPVLEIVAPTDVHATGAGSLIAAIVEPHFGTAHWRLGAFDGALHGAGLSALVDTALLDEGAHTLLLDAEDTIGNRSSLERELIVDRTAPVAEIVLPEHDAVLGGTQALLDIIGTASDLHFVGYTLTWSSVAAPGDQTVLIQSPDPVDAGPLFSLPMSYPEGEYVLRLNVLDRAGHRAEVAQHVHIDTTVPIADIDQPGDNAYVSRRLLVHGSASDRHLVDYRLRIATPAQASQGLWSDLLVEQRSVTAGEIGGIDLPMPDGEYLLELVVRDRAGHSVADRIRIRLDTTAPTAPIDLVAHRQGAAGVALAWRDIPTDDLAGFRLYRDGVVVNTALIGTRSHLDVPVPDGNLRYEVTAVDRAGNESARSNIAVVLVDRTPPDVELATPSEGAIVSGSVEVIGTAFSADDFSRYRLTLSDVAGQMPAMPLAVSSASVRSALLANWDTRTLPQGVGYRLLLEAWDLSGNRAEDQVEVVIDNLAPAAPTGLQVTASGDDGDVHWDENSEPDLRGYVLMRNGNAVNAPGILPDDLRVLALQENHYVDVALVDGRHTWTVFAIDHAGNLSPPSPSVQLDVARRPPDIRIAEPVQNHRFDGALRILALSEDQDIALVWFEYRAVGADTWSPLGAPMSTAPYAQPWAPGSLPRGAYDIRALARDSDGLEDATPATVRVHYVDLEPTAPPTDIDARGVGAGVRVTWTGVDAADLEHYRVERSHSPDFGFAPVTQVPAGTEHFTHDEVNDGLYYYRVVAVDTAGNGSAASGADVARVFSIDVRTPYTPTHEDHVSLYGSASVSGRLSIVRIDGDLPVPLSQTSIVAGDFSVQDVPLNDGENHLQATLRDEDDNISRAADVWISSAQPPSAPTGLSVTVANHDVHASWAVNPEADVIGYRLFRRDFAVPAEQELEAIAVDGVPDDQSSAAIDGDPLTAWLANSWFSEGDLSGIWLEVHTSEPRLISGLRLSWLDGRMPRSFDVQAYSGRSWVRVASFAESQPGQTLRFAAAYRTSRLRIVPTSARDGQSIALAELAVLEHPLIPFTTYDDRHLIDGRYAYEVTAVDSHGFESIRSAPAIAEVGDAQPPEPVVLSGEVQGSSAVLHWVPSVSSDVAHYQLFRNGTSRAVVVAALTEYADTGLANGSYVYSVVALDAFGNSSQPSNPVTLHVSNQAPGIPTNLQVTPLTRGAALLVRWMAGSGASSVRYTVRRAQDAAGPFSVIADATSLQYVDAPLENGVPYWYTVEAWDDAGNASGQSAAVSGVPVDQEAPEPPTLTYPAHDGERVDIQSDRTIVAGAAEPGTQVDVLRSGAAQQRVPSPHSDRSQAIGGYVSGRLRAAPGGSWFFGDESPPYSMVNSGASSVWAPSGARTGWTRDDRIVNRDGEGRWWSSALDRDDQRPIDLPIDQVENAAFSTDLRYALVSGQSSVDGVATRALWVVDRRVLSVRRVLGIEPDAVAFATVEFSETAGVVAWRSDIGALWAMHLADGQPRMLAAMIEPARISLSARDGALLYASRDANVPMVHRSSLDGSEHSSTAGHVAVWSPDGGLYLVATPDNRLVLHDAATDVRLRDLDFTAVEILDLQWTMSGRIVVQSPSSMYVIDPAGYFRSDAVTLLPGDNHLDLFAVDLAGLGQANRAAGVVRTVGAVAASPDLSIRAEDIRFLPASGLSGQDFAAQLTIRNVGAAASAATSIRARLIGTDGGVTELASPPLVPAISAGSSVSVGMPLGRLVTAGAYWLSIELLAGPGDANASNHLASQRLIVTATAEPMLDLVADAAVFAPDTDVRGRIVVRNTGPAWSGRVRVSVSSGNGDSSVQLPDVPIHALAFGTEVSQAWRWAAQGAPAGTYRAHAVLVDEQGRVLSSRDVPFAIEMLRDLRLSVASDRPNYVVGDTARIHATLNFSSGNAAVVGSILRMRVLDSIGNEVHVAARPLATLLPGYALQIPVEWTISGSVGLYSIRAELIEANVPVALAQNSLLVSPPQSAGAITGIITALPNPLIAGRNGQIDFALINQTAAQLAVNALRLRLLRTADMQEVAQSMASGEVPVAGGRLVGTLSLNDSQLPPGDYLAVLDWRDAGMTSPQNLVARSIAVIDGMAPAIELRTPVDQGWVTSSTAISALVSDAHAGVDRVEVSIDGGAWRLAPAQAEGLYGIDASGLADGVHRFRFRARDRAGNESISDERGFRVDNTSPRITITGIGDGDVVARPVTPMVVVDEAYPDRSAIALNAAPFVSATTIEEDGQYLLTAVAHDLAGNAASASVRFEIDTAPPTVTFIAPANNEETSAASVEVLVQTDPASNVRLEAGVFAGTTAADSAGVARFPEVPLSIGSNDLSATATDLAGNRSATASVRVLRIDYSGAVLTGSLIPTVSEVPSGQPIGLEWQLVNPRPAPIPAQAFQVRVIHAASAMPLGEQSLTTDLPSHGQAAGSLQFDTASAPLGQYVATLLAQIDGEAVQLATAAFDVIDGEPPALAIVSPTDGALLGDAVRIRATAVDASGDVHQVRYRLSGEPAVAMAQVAGEANIFQSELLDLVDAAYVLEVEAVDRAGNLAVAPRQGFTVDRSAPIIGIGDVVDGTAYGTSVAPTVVVTDPHLSAVEIRLDDQPFVSGTVVDGEGAHVLSANAVDGAGNRSQRNVRFRIDRTAPVVSFSFPAEGAVVATPEIAVGGLSEPSARVELRAGAISAWVNADEFGGFVLSGVSLQQGINVLEARAHDAVGNVSDWVSRTVVYRPNAGASLTAELTVSTSQLSLGDTLAVQYTLRNTSAIAVTALPMRVLWIRLADQQQLSSHPFSVDLATSASTSGSTTMSSADTVPGAHVVVLEGFLVAADGGSQWQALASVEVNVRDATGPTIELLEPLADSYVPSAFVVRARAEDLHSPVVSAEAVIGSLPTPLAATAVPGEFRASITVGEEGALHMSARAVDSAGNQAVTASRRIVVDLFPPRITISGFDDGAVVNHAVIPLIDVDDVSPSQTEVTLDGQAFTSGTEVSVEGRHVLIVVAVDALGRRSEARRRFTIDRTPPSASISTPADGAIIFSDGTRVVGATEPMASVVLSVGSFSAVLAADGQGVFDIGSVPLVPGRNRVSVRATDLAGNSGDEFAIHVDRRAQPVAALQGTLALPASDWSNGDDLTFQIDLRNIGTADLTALPVRVEARRYGNRQLLRFSELTIDLVAGAGTREAIHWQTSDWGLGVIEIRLSARLPGHDDVVMLDTRELLLMDREAPTVAIEQPPSQASVRTGDLVRVRAGDRLSHVALVELSIDGGHWFPVPAADVLAGRYEAPLPPLSNGSHQLRARCHDDAGNVAVTEDRSIQVVGPLPLNVESPVNGLSTTMSTIDFSGVTSPGASVRIVRGDMVWMMQAGTDGRFRLAGVVLLAGHNDFVLQAQDQLGNVSPAVGVRVTAVGLVAPIPAVGAWMLAWLIMSILIVSKWHRSQQEPSQ